MTELRAFVIIIFSHQTLYSDASVIKISGLAFHCDYVKILIPVGKTDPRGKGQSGILPRRDGEINPVSILCEYLKVFGFNDYPKIHF